MGPNWWLDVRQTREEQGESVRPHKGAGWWVVGETLAEDKAVFSCVDHSEPLSHC